MERPIVLASRATKVSERDLPIFDLELAALSGALKILRPYTQTISQ